MDETKIYGAYDYRDWWITVWAAPDAKVPERCACCGDEDEEELVDEKVVSTDHPEFTYKICRVCRRHARIDGYALGISFVGAVVVPPVVYLCLFGPHFLRRGLVMTGLLYLVVGALVGGAIYLTLQKFIDRYETCVDTSWPIDADVFLVEELLGDATERADERKARMLSKELKIVGGSNCVGLRFRNREYAMEFITLNGGDPEEMQLIDAEM